ncbi:hypothetical protein Bhyg_09665, partial [Pseudolycoriella hygida]
SNSFIRETEIEGLLTSPMKQTVAASIPFALPVTAVIQSTEIPMDPGDFGLQCTSDNILQKEIDDLLQQNDDISKRNLALQDALVSKQNTVLPFPFEAKAGPERKYTGKGNRNSSTIKKNCPVKIRIRLQGGKLVVTQADLTHKNHDTDEVTYTHYPENLRIPKEKLPEVRRMISLRVNKQLLKADLEADGTSIIPLKALHNIQTAMNKEKQSNYSSNGDLQKILEKLEATPNCT